MHKNIHHHFILMSLAFGLLAVSFSALTSAKVLAEAKFSVKMDIKEILTSKGFKFSLDSKTKFINYIAPEISELKLSRVPKDTLSAAKIFLSDYGGYFGMKSLTKDLNYVRTKTDNLGNKYVYYEQKYNGVPVFGGDIVVHIKPDLSVNFAHGRLFKPNISVKAKIKESKVLDNAKKYAKTELGMVSPEVVSFKKYIFNKNNINVMDENKDRLVWEVAMREKGGAGMEMVYVDAGSGAVIYNITGIKSANRRICDCRTAGGCFTGEDIKCGADLRAEGDPAYGDADVDDLYDIIGTAEDYFRTVHGINGANNLGGTGTGRKPHPSARTESYAYFIPTSTWPGCTNSFWTREETVFCRNTINMPVIGHEYGHAVNQYNAQSVLVYNNESGQVEEALADIWGQGVERYATGASSWKIGPSNRVWRDIINLTTTTPPVVFPDTFYSANYLCEANCNRNNDFCHVHHNSVLLSHMAYILSAGGRLNGCDVQGIGQEKVERIFFQALNTITSGTRINDLDGILDTACSDLYTANSNECINLRIAKQAAELGQGGRCGGTAEATPLCQLDLTTLIPRYEMIISDPSTILDAPDELVQPRDYSDLLPTSTLNQNQMNDDVAQIPDTTNTAKPFQISPETKTAPAQEVVDRTPSFTVEVIQNGKHVEIKGLLNYYGKGSKCSGPRYFDPIIVGWGQVNSHPVLNKDNTFTASHDYVVKNKTYDLWVSVTNSCFGSHVFHKTLTFPL